MSSLQKIKAIEARIEVLKKEMERLQGDCDLQRLIDFDGKLTLLLDEYDIPFNEVLYTLVHHFRTPREFVKKLAKLADLKPPADAVSITHEIPNDARVGLEFRAEAVREKWAGQFAAKSLDEWLS